uniref:AlNc14C74G5006 protein n=1 Tax=Albugo laibachii Nc14 TaxID=890382 RepID=F0WEE9_9STRA|nr:AlNc14C74G5006 [Albugo laibachii Nc14]|eukprot:CCA19581.1 AlNc14C74G5006 [Albugo laibachii Nc14]
MTQNGEVAIETMGPLENNLNMYYPHDKSEWNLYPSCAEPVDHAPLSCSGPDNLSYQYPAAYYAVSEQYPWTYAPPHNMSPQYSAYKYRRRRNSMHKPSDRIKERNGKSLCIRYITKGTCVYGSKCKFFHDKNATSTLNPFHENYEKRHRSMSAEGSSGSTRYVRRTDGKPKSQPLYYNMYRDIYHILYSQLIRIVYSDWDTFPSLENTVPASIEDRIPDAGAKLFFRDAVLKQQAKTDARDTSNQESDSPSSPYTNDKARKIDAETRNRRFRNQENQALGIHLEAPPYCHESFEQVPTVYTSQTEELSSGQFEYTSVYPTSLDSNDQTSRFRYLKHSHSIYLNAQ